jgi:hypothetical protein
MYVNCDGKKSEDGPQALGTGPYKPVKIQGPSFGAISADSVVSGQQYASGGDMHIRHEASSMMSRQF